MMHLGNKQAFIFSIIFFNHISVTTSNKIILLFTIMTLHSPSVELNVNLSSICFVQTIYIFLSHFCICSMCGASWGNSTNISNTHKERIKHGTLINNNNNTFICITFFFILSCHRIFFINAVLFNLYIYIMTMTQISTINIICHIIEICRRFCKAICNSYVDVEYIRCSPLFCDRRDDE